MFAISQFRTCHFQHPVRHATALLAGAYRRLAWHLREIEKPRWFSWRVLSFSRRVNAGCRQTQSEYSTRAPIARRNSTDAEPRLLPPSCLQGSSDIAIGAPGGTSARVNSRTKFSGPFSDERLLVRPTLPRPPCPSDPRWGAASHPVLQCACAPSSAERTRLVPVQCCGGVRP